MKKIFIAVIILIAGIALLVLKTINDAGEFKNLAPHADCKCIRVQNVPGPEDIAIDSSTGTAFISSFDRREFAKGNLIQGAIFAYNLEDKPALKNLTAELKIGFYPHGISFYAAPDGKKYLFAINHQKTKNYVEIFEFRNKALAHIETVGGDLLISPNDLTAVGPRQFYFTNDHGSKSDFGRLLEDYLQLTRSNVAFFDGEKTRIVADGFGYANGIWAANDNKRLYVAATTGKKFYAYERSADGSLGHVSTISLDTGADNIDIDSSGNILVAGHPKMLTFLKHAGNKAHRSPSQILKIVKDEKGGYAFREIYLTTGEEISAASVASAYKNRLLIGSVFDNYFLDCTTK